MQLPLQLPLQPPQVDVQLVERRDAVLLLIERTGAILTVELDGMASAAAALREISNESDALSLGIEGDDWGERLLIKRKGGGHHFDETERQAASRAHRRALLLHSSVTWHERLSGGAQQARGHVARGVTEVLRGVTWHEESHGGVTRGHVVRGVTGGMRGHVARGVMGVRGVTWHGRRSGGAQQSRGHAAVEGSRQLANAALFTTHFHDLCAHVIGPTPRRKMRHGAFRGVDDASLHGTRRDCTLRGVHACHEA